jgi:hypothetical protein
MYLIYSEHVGHITILLFSKEEEEEEEKNFGLRKRPT